MNKEMDKWPWSLSKVLFCIKWMSFSFLWVLFGIIAAPLFLLVIVVIDDDSALIAMNYMSDSVIAAIKSSKNKARGRI